MAREVIQKWNFGQPSLASSPTSRATWLRGTNPPLAQKGSTGWVADLYGGVQTGGDWARLSIPVKEMPTTQFKHAMWSYYMDSADVYGVNLVIWVHDANDFDKRAEITQAPSAVGLERGAEWNAHELDITTTQFFFYGENTTGVVLTKGVQYTWEQFQTDALFKDWLIYRITLEFGWYSTGSFGHAYIADLKLNWITIQLGPSIGDLVNTKTIETELQAIVAVAADAQDTSSTLDLTAMKKMAIFIDHGRDATSAFVGAGTEYRVEVSEKATGNDTWRPIASATAAITVALGHAMDGTEVVGQTQIEIGATTPLLGDIQFFKNGTIANSEWARIIDVDDGVTFTIQDGLTNEQAAITTYSQGEHFTMLLDVSAYTRLRVVCNNNNGSTNQNIVWRCAAIDQT